MSIKYLSIKFFLLFSVLISTAYSDGILTSNNNVFLKVDEAFKISLDKKSNKSITVNFNICLLYTSPSPRD